MHSFFAGKPLPITASESRGMAAWLVDKSALSFEQIAAFTGLPRIEVKLIADDELAPRPVPIDPIRQGWIDGDDLGECERHPNRPVARPWAWGLSSLAQSFTKTLADVPISGARLTRLAFLAYGRNAWHSTWITRYYKAGSVALTVGALQAKAEKLRTQGSVFRIEEMPALVLQTEAATLFLVEVNRGQHLNRLEDDLNGALFSHRIVRTVGSLPSNSIVCLQADERIIPPPLRETQPFHLFRSQPQGSGRNLGWSKSPRDVHGDVERYRSLEGHLASLNDLTDRVWRALADLPPEARLNPSNVEFESDDGRHFIKWDDARFPLEPR